MRDKGEVVCGVVRIIHKQRIGDVILHPGELQRSTVSIMDSK